MIKKNNRDYIVFIESNTTGTGRLFLKKATLKGLKTVFITKDPNKYDFLNKDLIQPIILDTDSEEEIYTELKNLKNLKAIFSTSEYYIETACNLARKFNLLANNPKAINICRNKDLLAKKLSEYGIICQKTLTVSSINEINNNLSQINFGFPVIVKPTKGSGSIGVRLCYNEEEVHKHGQFLLKENKSILIQEYIEGDEYSVETLSFNNQTKIIGITKKHLSNPPYFLEIGHDFPAIVSKTINTKIEELILNTFIKVGLIFGPAHTEIRIKNNTPYIIEINPRLAGGMIPELIKQAKGIDLLDTTLDLLIGKEININEKNNGFSSIRFIIPKKSGFIKSIQFNRDNLKNKTIDFKITRNLNNFVTLRGDFRDRIGYIIVKEKTLNSCQDLANTLVNSILIKTIKNMKATPKNSNAGRLKATLLPEVQVLINQKKSINNRIKELNLLTQIDEAHIIMLLETENISKKQALLLLRQIEKLKMEKFHYIVNSDAPRGTYLLYESFLTNKLGIDLAGIIHTARSRNDINSTIFKLNIRKQFFNIYQNLWRLRSSLVNHAKLNLKTSIPIYSQYQTALPGTLAHYLLGVEAALTREQIALQSVYPEIATCPLGAGAGGGTSIFIDQSITSQLLGFLFYSSNSLDAVASRDLALRILSILCSCSMTLSRITEDLQLWSTNEFKFIDFPDTLSGCSSMMPQKKNPYLLEKIKGSLLSMIGYYVNSITTMYKVPFGNSVEIGTESLRYMDKAYDEFIRVTDLLIVIIKNIKINEVVSKKNQLENLTISTYITDLLVKNKICNFRQAYQKIGESIRSSLDNNVDPIKNLSEILKPTITNLDIDPLNIALKLEYGGGPGIQSITHQYWKAITCLNKHSEWIQRKKRKIIRSNIKMKNKINEIAELI